MKMKKRIENSEYSKMTEKERLKAADSLNNALTDLQDIDAQIIWNAYINTRKGREL